MKTVVVVGGTHQDGGRVVTYGDVQVINHDYTSRRRNGRKAAESMVRRADAIVILERVCSHQGMWSFRELAKSYQKPVLYTNGSGASRVIREVENFLQELAGGDRG